MDSPIYGVGQTKDFGPYVCTILFSGLVIVDTNTTIYGTTMKHPCVIVPLETLKEIVKWYEEVSKP